MADNLGFAIPVNYVKDFLRNREAFSFDKDNPNTGYRYLDPPRRLRAGRPPGAVGLAQELEAAKVRVQSRTGVGTLPAGEARGRIPGSRDPNRVGSSRLGRHRRIRWSRLRPTVRESLLRMCRGPCGRAVGSGSRSPPPVSRGVEWKRSLQMMRIPLRAACPPRPYRLVRPGRSVCSSQPRDGPRPRCPEKMLP